MIRQTVSTTMALLATTPQAIDLLQSIEPKADIGTSGSSTNSAGEIVYPANTWAFTKTGNLNLVNCMLDGSCNGNGSGSGSGSNGSGSGSGSDNDDQIAKDRKKAAADARQEAQAEAARLAEEAKAAAEAARLAKEAEAKAEADRLAEEAQAEAARLAKEAEAVAQAAKEKAVAAAAQTLAEAIFAAAGTEEDGELTQQELSKLFERVVTAGVDPSFADQLTTQIMEQKTNASKQEVIDHLTDYFMKNEGKEDEAKVLLTALNDTDPVLAPDAAETNYWDFIKLAQEKQVEPGYLVRIDKEWGLACGVQTFHFERNDIGDFSITKNTCTDKIAIVTYFWKNDAWDNGIDHYYQTYNTDGTKVMQDSVKSQPCVDDLPTPNEGDYYRVCQFIVGHVDDWEARGLGQADQSIFGMITKPDYHANYGPDSRIDWCQTNNPAQCSWEMDHGMRSASHNYAK